MKNRGAYHYSATELPLIIEFMNAREIEYEIRKIKYPSTRGLCHSVSMKFDDERINEEIHNFHKFCLRGS